MVVDLLLGAGGIVALWAVAGLRVVRQFERGVVFRFGRVQSEVRAPGLTRIHPGVDRFHRVNMQIVTMPVPAQDGITRDNVTVKVDAVVYFKVIDPVRVVVDVQDYRAADRAGRADLAALDHRQERPRRPAVQPRAAQPGPGADDRQPGAGLGRGTSTASRSRTWRCRRR